MFAVVIFILLVYGYGLLSQRLEQTVFGIPLVFTLVGIVLAIKTPDLVRLDVGGKVWLFLAEITFAIVVFNGATRVRLRTLRGQMLLPGRLLLVGLPLTIIFGILAAWLVLPGLSFWEAGILGCMLASTDTSLAELILRSPRVPACIREVLSVESGLSDGLVVPFVVLFISLIKAEAVGVGIVFVRIMLQQIGLGIAVGVAIGLVGGGLLALARRWNWATASFQQIALIALVPLIWIVSKSIDSSPFIAAFAAGIAVKVGFREASEGTVDFCENQGRVLQMFVFYLFGISAGLALGEFHLRPILYAILSLTLVRMIPVAISLRGAHLSKASVLFIGWFGPRGLASIVLGLVVAGQQIESSGSAVVRLSLIATVLFSIFAHGLSASPGVRLYARRIARLGVDAPEYEAASEIPATLENAY